MFSCRDFRARGGSRAIRNEAMLDHCIYSREFASIRGLNNCPPPHTSFVVERIHFRVFGVFRGKANCSFHHV